MTTSMITVFVIIGWAIMTCYIGVSQWQSKAEQSSTYPTSNGRLAILLLVSALAAGSGVTAVVILVAMPTKDSFILGTLGLVLASGVTWTICGCFTAQDFFQATPLRMVLRLAFIAAAVLNAFSWNQSLVYWIDASANELTEARAVFAYWSVALSVSLVLAGTGMSLSESGSERGAFDDVVATDEPSGDSSGSSGLNQREFGGRRAEEDAVKSGGEQQQHEEGAACPEFEVSLYSRLSFSWVGPILERGLVKPLDFCDIFELVEVDTCAVNENIFSAAWALETAPRQLPQKPQQQQPPSQQANTTLRSSSFSTDQLLKEPLLLPPEDPTNRPETHNAPPTFQASPCPPPPGPASTSLMRTLLWHGYRGRVGSVALLRLLGILATYAQPVLISLFISAIDKQGSGSGKKNDDGLDHNDDNHDDDDEAARRRQHYQHIRLLFSYAFGLFALSLASASLDAHYGLVHHVFSNVSLCY